MGFTRGAVVLGFAIAVCGPAFGQEAAPPEQAEAPAAAPAPDRFSPLEMLNGPSLRETGRIGGMTLSSTPSELQPAADRGSRGEKSIQQVAAGLEAEPPPRRVGRIDAATLEREVREHLATLDGCRIEVARRRQVTPDDVRADQLTLRWTIRPTGDVGATEVVAVSPTDLDMMDCVKASMSTWSFTRPRGGPVSVERDFKFKPAPQLVQ